MPTKTTCDATSALTTLHTSSLAKSLRTDGAQAGKLGALGPPVNQAGTHGETAPVSAKCAASSAEAGNLALQAENL